MIHSNAYDLIVQISVRAKQMKLNQANTNTHYANHNIHTQTHIAHTTNRTQSTATTNHSDEQRKKATQQKVMEKRRHRHLAALSAAESFLVYGHLNEITHSVWFRALSRQHVSITTHNFKSPLQRNFFLSSSRCALDTISYH